MRPQGRLAKRTNPLGRKKPMRGAVSYQFRRWQETRTLARHQALKWRLRPTTRGLRHPQGCTILQLEKSLKGTTPWTWPARNKAGGSRVDQSLESVKTLRRHPNLEWWFSPGRMWLPASSNVVGAKTAREAVRFRRNPGTNGTGSIILCRGAKGHERIVWEESLFPGTRCCENLKG
jgi:hypothetical protein